MAYESKDKTINARKTVKNYESKEIDVVMLVEMLIFYELVDDPYIRLDLNMNHRLVKWINETYAWHVKYFWCMNTMIIYRINASKWIKREC